MLWSLQLGKSLVILFAHNSIYEPFVVWVMLAATFARCAVMSLPRSASNSGVSTKRVNSVVSGVILELEGCGV